MQDYSTSVTRQPEFLTRRSSLLAPRRALCIALAAIAASVVCTAEIAVVGTVRGTNIVDAIDYTPLGEPGALSLPTQLLHRAEFRAPPVRRPALALVDGDAVATIVCNLKARDGTGALASELAWHLKEMCGRELKVVDVSQKPASGPVVVIGNDDGAAPELASIVRVDGRELYIGGVGNGVSQALTYVLESLGCRYLFPGAAGKVIPKRDRIVVDDISLDYVPRLKVRLVKRPLIGHPKYHAALLGAGYSPDECSRIERAHWDRPGNRDFWKWHGVVSYGNIVKTSTPTFQATVLAGHNFLDYYQRFFGDHPEWFALQNTGSREQETNSRPRLCTSNPGLREQVARDVSRVFESRPDRRGASICMPDFNYMTFCMCDDCRRLDPANSPVTRGYLYRSPEKPHAWAKHPFAYVSLTDRMVDFSNDIQRRVRAVHPGRHVVQFAYGNYSLPPVKTRPDPDIVFFNVDGNYSKAKSIGAHRSHIAAWLSLGNPTVWRPNCLMGLGRPNCHPANFGRLFFQDISDFKANGVIGVSLDCCSGNYSAQGFMFYMVAKAMTNPDRLDYDAIADDWCRSGFGPAAGEIAAYMQELERLYMAAAERGDGVGGYVDAFDIGAFEARLDRARALAQGDPDVLARIDHLGVALEFAREAEKVRKAWWSGNWKTLRAAREVFRGRVREIVLAHPDAAWPPSCQHMAGPPATEEQRRRHAPQEAEPDAGFEADYEAVGK